MSPRAREAVHYLTWLVVCAVALGLHLRLVGRDGLLEAGMIGVAPIIALPFVFLLLGALTAPDSDDPWAIIGFGLLLCFLALASLLVALLLAGG